MTIVSISRKKICDAIAKEPTTTLASGSWVSGPEEEAVLVRSRSCFVCAVGAVMRNALLDPAQSAMAICDASSAAVEYEGHGGAESYVSGDPVSLVQERAYMAALSAFFERANSSYQVNWYEGRKRVAILQQIKKDCIKFVKKNFPATVTVDIDGALPAKDVKIIA